jgi:hypothetical protein
MPKLTASKEEVKGLPVLTEGMYTVRLDGFEPKLDSKKTGVNLNPLMKVINHPEFNDRRVFENLSTKGKWVWPDFCHAFGVAMPEAPGGELEFPGDWDGPQDEPDKWQYRGPLLGQQAQIYVIQTDDTKGGVRNAIKYYVCKLAGCSSKHSSNLAK